MNVLWSMMINDDIEVDVIISEIIPFWLDMKKKKKKNISFILPRIVFIPFPLLLLLLLSLKRRWMMNILLLFITIRRLFLMKIFLQMMEWCYNYNPNPNHWIWRMRIRTIRKWRRLLIVHVVRQSSLAKRVCLTRWILFPILLLAFSLIHPIHSCPYPFLPPFPNQCRH